MLCLAARNWPTAVHCGWGGALLGDGWYSDLARHVTSRPSPSSISTNGISVVQSQPLAILHHMCSRHEQALLLYIAQLSGGKSGDPVGAQNTPPEQQHSRLPGPQYQHAHMPRKLATPPGCSPDGQFPWAVGSCAATTCPIRQITTREPDRGARCWAARPQRPGRDGNPAGRPSRNVA